MPLPLQFPAISPYLGADELRNFYGQAEVDQLADRDSDGQADKEVVETAIERAAAELDGMLAKCYPLPLQAAAGFSAISAHVGWLLAEWTGVIARYRLWDDVRLRSSGEQKTEARLRYEDVLKKLSGLDPCKRCGCDLLGPSVLTNVQAGIAVHSNMPEVASSGTVWKRTDWDFAGNEGVRKHAGRAFNELQ